MKEFFETLVILAGIQGVLLSAVLFTKKNNHSANIVLAVASLALSFELFTKIYYSKGIYLQFPQLIGITYPLPYTFGPLFFIYTRLITKKQSSFRYKDLLHFLPVLVIYCISLPVFLSDNQGKIAFVARMIINDPPPVYRVIENLISPQGLIYTILTVRTVLDYNKSIKNSFSNIDKINLNWLKHITISLIIIWSIVVMMFYVKFFFLTKGFGIILEIMIAVFIYSVGYMGLKQPEIFMPADTMQPSPAKYQKSGLSEESAEGIKQKLLDIMAVNKPYLDSELTLVKLAELSGISVHNLSEVINSKLNESYFDFINSYRVEEFKNRLNDPANSSLSLIGIAYDSGFNSKTTFYKIFKKFTGMTPSEFKARSGNFG